MFEVRRGDCLDLLSEVPPESVDLCYLDPPFFTGSGWSNAGGEFGDQWRSDSGRATVTDEGLGEDTRNIIDAIARFRPLKNYLRYMAHRLAAIRRVLKPAGSIWVHCNDKAVAELRILLGAIFLRSAFMNQIVLSPGSKRPARHKLATVNSYLLVFAARSQQNIVRTHSSVRSYLNPKYQPPNAEELFKLQDEGGQYRMVHSSWAVKRGSGVKAGYRKQYRHEFEGFTLTDRWDDIPCRVNESHYPTQKPTELLRRIVGIGSPNGGLVLDPFCGSGTAGVAALELGRRFIGMDINIEAVEIADKRLALAAKQDSDGLGSSAG